MYELSCAKHTFINELEAIHYTFIYELIYKTHTFMNEL